MHISPWQWSASFIAREFRVAAKFVRSSKGHKVALATLLLVVTAVFTTISSQSTAKVPNKPEVQRVNVGLQQCATLPEICASTDSAQWQTGDLNENNSDYAEGQTVPYRAAFTKLTVGQVYKLSIGWDSTKNGLHAHDYLTSFDISIPTAMPCDATICGTGTPATIAIPADATLGTISQIPGVITAYGATFTEVNTVIPAGSEGNLCATYPCTITANPTAYTPAGDAMDDSTNELSVYFTATSTTAVIAWGGHIASSSDWGPRTSASSINGSPYHMRLNALACQNDNCSSGNLDRSMKVAAAPAVTTTTDPTTTVAPTTTVSPETTVTPTTVTPTTVTPTTVTPTTVTPTTVTPTTVPPATTVAPSTTGSPGTTAAPGTTSSPGSTSAPATETTVNVTTTINDPNLQIINPDIELPTEPDFLVQFPDNLPSTGSWFNFNFLVTLILILLGTALLFLAGVIVQHRFFIKR